MRYVSDSTGITVIDKDNIYMVGASDVAYADVKSYLLGGGQDSAIIRGIIIEAKEDAVEALKDAESAVDGDSPADALPYRIVHGDPVRKTVLSTAVRIKREGGDSKALKKFVKRLRKNPSEASRSQLFAWLAAGGFSITKDGLIIAYKGVRDDYTSFFKGKEPVTVKYADGTVKVIVGHIHYPVGAAVSMPRELVDADRSVSCSVGIHASDDEYAHSYGTRRIVVLIDPADVVSVPNHECRKVRVCGLFVAADYTGKGDQKAIGTVPDSDALRAYLADPENAIGDDTDDVDADDDFEDNSVEDPADKVKEVADALGAKLVKFGDQTRRDLSKRCSKSQRPYFADAMDYLIESGEIAVNDDGTYSLA